MATIGRVRRAGSGLLMGVGVTMTVLAVFGPTSSAGMDSGPVDSTTTTVLETTTVPEKPTTTTVPETTTTVPQTTTTVPQTTTTVPETTTTVPETTTTVPSGRPHTGARASVDCQARRLVVTLTNTGDAPGRYTVAFTPDAGSASTSTVDVAANGTATTTLAVVLPATGHLDVRSADEVVLDHQRIAETCTGSKTTAEATVDCSAKKIVVTLTNTGDAPGRYTLTFTPDQGSPVSTVADVPAASKSTYALAVTPPQRGRIDVRSDVEVVLDGKRIEVTCEEPTTTTVAPTTTVPVSVAPTTIVRTQDEALAYTGSDANLPLAAVGITLFMLGLISLELRTPVEAHARRRR